MLCVSPERRSPGQADTGSTDHFLYFPKQIESSPEDDWLALVKQPVTIAEDIEHVRGELEQLAAELGAEYGGWGAAVK